MDEKEIKHLERMAITDLTQIITIFDKINGKLEEENENLRMELLSRIKKDAEIDKLLTGKFFEYINEKKEITLCTFIPEKATREELLGFIRVCFKNFEYLVKQ